VVAAGAALPSAAVADGDSRRLLIPAAASGPLAVAFATTPAAATPGAAADQAVTRIESLGTRFNQAMFDLNIWLGSIWRSAVPAAPAGGRAAAVDQALGNLLNNWINEPLSMVSYAATGRFDQAGIAAQRFVTNTVTGWGGLEDPATERGLVVPKADVGLGLCSLGVPAGPYVVVPVVGPRTLRDAVADLLVAGPIVNGALLVAGGLAPPVQAVLGFFIVDELLSLAVARQIDSVPVETTETMGYDATRAAYLADRAARCERLDAAR